MGRGGSLWVVAIAQSRVRDADIGKWSAYTALSPSPLCCKILAWSPSLLTKKHTYGQAANYTKDLPFGGALQATDECLFAAAQVCAVGAGGRSQRFAVHPYHAASLARKYLSHCCRTVQISAELHFGEIAATRFQTPLDPPYLRI